VLGGIAQLRDDGHEGGDPPWDLLGIRQSTDPCSTASMLAISSP
jgi:hypothetical protein